MMVIQTAAMDAPRLVKQNLYILAQDFQAFALYVETGSKPLQSNVMTEVIPLTMDVMKPALWNMGIIGTQQLMLSIRLAGMDRRL